MEETMILGTGLKPNLDWVQANYPDAWDKVLARLSDHDRRQLELVNGALKYQVGVFDRFCRAFADIQFAGDPSAAGEAFKRMGRHTGTEQLSGVYSVFLKVASIEGTLKKAPQLLGRIYEGVSGHAEVLPTGDGPNGTMTITGLGGLAYSSPRLIGWAEAALDALGAKNGRVAERSWDEGRIVADPLYFELYWG